MLVMLVVTLFLAIIRLEALEVTDKIRGADLWFTPNTAVILTLCGDVPRTSRWPRLRLSLRKVSD